MENQHSFIDPIKKLSKGDWCFFAIASAIYYILIRQYIRVLEDLYYSLEYTPTVVKPIRSLADAIHAQIHDYLYVNGRFLVHTVTQYLCGMGYWGQQFFYVLSTIFFFALLVGLTLIVRDRYKSSPCDKYILVLLISLLIPAIGRTYLGHMAFVINYLWVSAIITWFYLLYLYYSKSASHSKITNGLLFIFALICGSLQESFSIPIAGILFLYWICHLRKLFKNTTLLLLVVGFGIGSCICILAPGNFVRAASVEYLTTSNVSGIAKWVKSFTEIIKTCLAFDVLAIFTLLFLLFKRKKASYFIKRNLLFYSVALISLAFAIFVAFSASHQLTFMALMLILLIMDFIYGFALKSVDKNSIYIRSFSVIILALIYIPAFGYRKQLVKAWDEMMVSAKNTKDSSAVAKDLYLFMSNTNKFYFDYTNASYACLHLDERHHDEVISLYLSGGKNKNLIKSILPESQKYIVEHCNNATKTSEGVYFLANCNCYVVRLSDKIELNTIQLKYSYELNEWDLIKEKIKGTNLLNDFIENNNPNIPNFSFKEYEYLVYTNKRYKNFEVYDKN